MEQHEVCVLNIRTYYLRLSDNIIVIVVMVESFIVSTGMGSFYSVSFYVNITLKKECLLI